MRALPRLLVATTAGLFLAACGGGGGGGGDGGGGGGGGGPPPGPPTEVQSTLNGCAPAVFDRWTFEVDRAQIAHIEVDTTDAASAADLCVVGRCGGVDIGGDDEKPCTSAPPSFACPATQLSSRRTGACTFDITSCSSVCTNAAAANYLLTVSVDGGGPALQQIGVAVPAAQRKRLCVGGPQDAEECANDGACPEGACKALPLAPPSATGVPSPPVSTTLPSNAVECVVHVRMNADVTYSTLKYKVDYRGTDGAFVGEGRNVLCTKRAGGSAFFNDLDRAHVLGSTFTSGTGIDGPVSLAECTFTSVSGQTRGDDFVLAILEATAPGGAAIAPELAVRINCGTTTTSASTSTTHPTLPPGSTSTVPTTPTTTLPGEACGALLTRWGAIGNAAGRFNQPSGIGADLGEDAVYVADTTNNRIQKFDFSGTFLRQWGGPGSQSGEFSDPIAVDVDQDGSVYVADSNNHRIQKFDTAGAFLDSWGTLGGADGQLRFPAGIAIGPDGSVYVADRGNTRIQKFDASGAFLRKWGSAGTAPGQFLSPEGISVGERGNVFVADSRRNRIIKFDAEGLFVAEFGATGRGEGQLTQPFDVHVEGGGDYFVADTGNDRIQKFDSQGVLSGAWGTLGPAAGQFNDPRAIVGVGDGVVFVADSTNHRVQKFQCR